MEIEARGRLLTAIAAGTAAQLAMVLAGHGIEAVANLFGVLGMTISLLAGVGYGLGTSSGALGGAVAGGACALLGIAVSLALGDVTAVILAFGTASSAVTGAIGGAAGAALARRRHPGRA